MRASGEQLFMCDVGNIYSMRFHYAGICVFFKMYYWLYLQYEVSLCRHLVLRTLLAIHTA